MSNYGSNELKMGNHKVYQVRKIIHDLDWIISIIYIHFRSLCISNVDFTKESLLNPCICQIQGFSKDSLVKSRSDIHNVRNSI